MRITPYIFMESLKKEGSEGDLGDQEKVANQPYQRTDG